jgi:hypothetical protein
LCATCSDWQAPCEEQNAMGKRPTARIRRDQPDLSQPSPWRLQHGGFDVAERGADPETGTPVALRRALDTLGMMEANGTITPAMRAAGDIFRKQFRAASLDTLRATPTVRLPRGTGGALTDRQLDARRRVDAALDALGGPESAAGSCVWHVVGLECSVREWATRQGWRGRPVGHSQAQGMLVAALGVLAAHYRLGAAR